MKICLTLERDADISLQEQLRKILIDAIYKGSLPIDEPLPSCRKLSEQLGISRNTVAIVYEGLADEGYLVSSPRRGYFLHDNYHEMEGLSVPDASNTPWTHLEASTKISRTDILNTKNAPNWDTLLKHRPSSFEGILKPSNWKDYPYPFIYGQLDAEQFPLPQWRSVTKRLLSTSREKKWFNDRVDQDDPLLIEQLRKRVLPRRGIFAEPEEILVTLGSQNALFLLGQLFLNSQTKIGIENPGYKEAANVFQYFGASLRLHDMDEDGIVFDESSPDCDFLYVTPSHQVPTGITMSNNRRKQLLQNAVQHNQIIFEDDYDAELHGDKYALPALKANSATSRVIYFSSLSKAFAPGLRLGYVVADAEVIDELRSLRRLMYRHPPATIQHQVAQFIAQGHYEGYLKAHVEESDRRRDLLWNALQTYIPEFCSTSSNRASAFWLKAKPSIDTQRLAWQASQQGVLIEPGQQHFFDSSPSRQFIRLGFHAIASELIVPGVKKFAESCQTTS